jgi:two-component system chemotaxis sensor kinase CheA
VDDILNEFITEAGDNLEQIDAALVVFEREPDDGASLASIFRLFHSIKGTAGFMGLAGLEAVAHAAETLLGRFRDGVLDVTPDAIDVIMAAVDRIKAILVSLEQTGAEPDAGDTELIARLEAAAEVQREIPTADLRTPATDEPAALIIPQAEPAPEGAEDAGALRPGEVSLADLEAAFAAAEAPVFAPAPNEASAPVAVAVTTAAQAKPPEAPQATVRVGLDVLEGMMTLVSELVLTRNQLLQVNRVRGDTSFSAPLQRLSSITGELQQTVTKTRMQPIGSAWSKLPRLVRELSRELGKPIDLVMEGEAVEVDRQVLELIKDPLTHMVRNSADHGLESPEAREAAGKPRLGTIRLSARPEGGSIVIRLSDDGRGLDGRRIRAKAVEQGLLSAAEAEALTDAQAYRLIFAAGFSTAAEVTSVSGRGVGMDVVSSNLERIGGQVEIQSIPGQGATFILKIPLTLSILAALIVRVGDQRFAIPQASVVELVRVGRGSPHRVEIIESIHMLRLREHLLPVLDLADQLQLGAQSSASGYVAVIQIGPRKFGVSVDLVIDTEEIVVKPLASVLRAVNRFSGATILGDGSVVLIVDPNVLAEQVGEVEGGKAADPTATDQAIGERTKLLLFRAGDQTLKAVELSRVTRLERVASSSLECANGRRVMQYRGRLAPVLAVDEHQTVGGGSSQPLLVFSGAMYAMALAVDQIIDVIEDRLHLELASDRPGVLGTAVIGGRAAEVLDIDHYLVLGLAAQAQIKSGASDAKEAA